VPGRPGEGPDRTDASHGAKDRAGRSVRPARSEWRTADPFRSRSRPRG